MRYQPYLPIVVMTAAVSTYWENKKWRTKRRARKKTGNKGLKMVKRKNTIALIIDGMIHMAQRIYGCSTRMRMTEGRGEDNIIPKSQTRLCFWKIRWSQRVSQTQFLKKILQNKLSSCRSCRGSLHFSDHLKQLWKKMMMTANL